MPTPEKVKERNRAYYARNAEAIRERSRTYYAENKKARSDYSKKWRAENRELVLRARAEWGKKNPEREQAARRKAALNARCKKFGITAERYEQMLVAQGGCCAICKSRDTGTRADWHIDHCHATGKVRGLLCHHCNAALGHVRDSIDTLNAMIFYLKGE